MNARQWMAVAGVSAALVGSSFVPHAGTVAAAAEAARAESLSPAEAASLIRAMGGRKDFVLLDVRTPHEYREAHIAGSVVIDFTSASFGKEVAKLDREKTYLLYCRSGNRSGRALALMKELHFTKVHHLSGGIAKWMEEGLPTVR